jgi:hypothetical protein
LHKLDAGLIKKVSAFIMCLRRIPDYNYILPVQECKSEVKRIRFYLDFFLDSGLRPDNFANGNLKIVLLGVVFSDYPQHAPPGRDGKVH